MQLRWVIFEILPDHFRQLIDLHSSGQAECRSLARRDLRRLIVVNASDIASAHSVVSRHPNELVDGDNIAHLHRRLGADFKQLTPGRPEQGNGIALLGRADSREGTDRAYKYERRNEPIFHIPSSRVSTGHPVQAKPKSGLSHHQRRVHSSKHARDLPSCSRRLSILILGSGSPILEQLQRVSCCTQLRHGNSAPGGDSLGRCPPPISDRPGRRP